MKKLLNAWNYIVEDNTVFFFRCKKALFLISCLTVISFFWKSYPDGSIISIIWDSLPYSGPTILVLLLIVMFKTALKRID